MSDFPAVAASPPTPSGLTAAPADAADGAGYIFDAHPPIDKGVPMPRARGSTYPFDTMDVGDSFAVPAGEAIKPKGGNLTQHTITSAAWAYGHRRGRKFSTRLLTEHGERVVRCWRTA